LELLLLELQVTITGASGGSAEDNGFMISSSATTILGFSLTGDTISAGEGILVEVTFTGSPDEICIENVVLSDPFGQALDVDVDDCWDGETSDDGGDDGGGDPEPQYFTDLPNQTGESTLVIIQEVEGLDVGDEIGVFDMNGVLETVDFGETPQYGEILVGSAVYIGDQVEISAILSIDLSDFDGPTLNGALEENSITYKVWKADEDAVYMAEAEYSFGNGLFGDLFNKNIGDSKDTVLNKSLKQSITKTILSLCHVNSIFICFPYFICNAIFFKGTI
jgi:hypothetical protein